MFAYQGVRDVSFRKILHTYEMDDTLQLNDHQKVFRSKFGLQFDGQLLRKHSQRYQR